MMADGGDVSDPYATGAGGIDIAWQKFGRGKGPRLLFISGCISVHIAAPVAASVKE